MKMKRPTNVQTNLDDASRDLPLLVQRAFQGEEIVITVDGQPMARLVGADAQSIPTLDRNTWVHELANNANAALVNQPSSTLQAYWDETRADRF